MFQTAVQFNIVGANKEKILKSAIYNEILAIFQPYLSS